MRRYELEVIENKYRQDMEQHKEYAVIIPLSATDILCYVEDAVKKDKEISSDICREVINFLELEMIMSFDEDLNKRKPFLKLVKDCTKKVCNMFNVKFIDAEQIHFLGTGNA